MHIRKIGFLALTVLLLICFSTAALGSSADISWDDLPGPLTKDLINTMASGGIGNKIGIWTNKKSISDPDGHCVDIQVSENVGTYAVGIYATNGSDITVGRYVNASGDFAASVYANKSTVNVRGDLSCTAAHYNASRFDDSKFTDTNIVSSCVYADSSTVIVGGNINYQGSWSDDPNDVGAIVLRNSGDQPSTVWVAGNATAAQERSSGYAVTASPSAGTVYVEGLVNGKIYIALGSTAYVGALSEWTTRPSGFIVELDDKDMDITEYFEPVENILEDETVPHGQNPASGKGFFIAGCSILSNGVNETLKLTLKDPDQTIRSLETNNEQVTAVISEDRRSVELTYGIHGGMNQLHLVLNKDYEITYGGGQSWPMGSENELTFRGSGELAEFVSAAVDGKEVDPQYYTVSSGSTVIGFKPAFLTALGPGNHTLTMNWQGGSASANFSIVSADPTPEKDDKNTPAPVPRTGDRNASMLSIAGLLMILSAAALIAVRKRSSK